MKTKDEISGEIVNQAQAVCDDECEKFMTENELLIWGLYKEERINDITKLFFKQGFLSGMRFKDTMREEIYKLDK